MHTAYIALGSNLDNPLKQVERARATLKSSPKIDLLKTSSWYTSRPMGCKTQPRYVNGALKIRTTMPPHALLKYLLKIELRQGRVRIPRQRNDARKIDIDLLLYDNKLINSATLTVPHPRMVQRSFVLLPLLEIEPCTRLPLGKALSDYRFAIDVDEHDCRRLNHRADTTSWARNSTKRCA